MNMEYTKWDIIARYNAGEKLDFVFFWKPLHNADGSLSEGCLGQWWMSDFEIDGVRYNCAEQYMMAEKARLFPNNEQLLKNCIMQAADPALHKQYGRQVKNFDADKWSSVSKAVVVKGNYAKFSQNEQLKQYLLSTGDKILVEASPYDAIWGIKLEASDPQALNPNWWKGTNHLGFALMQVRDMLNP